MNEESKFLLPDKSPAGEIDLLSELNIRLGHYALLQEQYNAIKEGYAVALRIAAERFDQKTAALVTELAAEKEALTAAALKYRDDTGRKAATLFFGSIKTRVTPAKISIVDADKALAFSKAWDIEIKVKKTPVQSALSEHFEDKGVVPDGCELIPEGHSVTPKPDLSLIKEYDHADYEKRIAGNPAQIEGGDNAF